MKSTKRQLLPRPTPGLLLPKQFKRLLLKQPAAPTYQDTPTLTLKGMFIKKDTLTPTLTKRDMFIKKDTPTHTKATLTHTKDMFTRKDMFTKKVILMVMHTLEFLLELMLVDRLMSMKLSFKMDNSSKMRNGSLMSKVSRESKREDSSAISRTKLLVTITESTKRLQQDRYEFEFPVYTKAFR